MNYEAMLDFLYEQRDMAVSELESASRHGDGDEIISWQANVKLVNQIIEIVRQHRGPTP